eukprot:GHVU01085451.1.p1 GENE.GHVU01085451.1~~GHVU01085451.1.p1  ORF type:complete len:225 (+),score=33.23 GHVU01085451.1:2686-3360(+)
MNQLNLGGVFVEKMTKLYGDAKDLNVHRLSLEHNVFDSDQAVELALLYSQFKSVEALLLGNPSIHYTAGARLDEELDGLGRSEFKTRVTLRPSDPPLQPPTRPVTPRSGTPQRSPAPGTPQKGTTTPAAAARTPSNEEAARRKRKAAPARDVSGRPVGTNRRAASKVKTAASRATGGKKKASQRSPSRTKASPRRAATKKTATRSPRKPNAVREPAPPPNQEEP